MYCAWYCTVFQLYDINSKLSRLKINPDNHDSLKIQSIMTGLVGVKTKRILVPLDGSKNSLRGLDMAIHIARQSQGTITALAVKSVPGIYAIHPLGFLDFNSMTEVKKIA